MNTRPPRTSAMPLPHVIEDRGYETPCWIFDLKANDGNGYGVVRVDGRVQKAHRVSYQQRYGAIDPRAHIDHLCRQRACINPEHLESVTPAENSRRSAMAKLTYADLEEIRGLLKGGMSQYAVSRAFGVRPQTINQIALGLRWAAPGGVI